MGALFKLELSKAVCRLLSSSGRTVIILDDDPINPEIRYKLFSTFDVVSYDADLQDFPDFFDENGWPLFGDYDPYSLKHPITGQSWHLSPRIPRSGEQDPDYDSWFFIASTFLEEAHLILKPVFKSLSSSGTKQQERRVLIRFSPEAEEAPEGNFSYLRNLMARLGPLIASRNATPQMIELWGEFCSVLSELPSSVSDRDRRRKHREETAKRIEGGSRDNRFAQIKGYLHCRRRYCENEGRSVRWLHKELQDIIFSLSINATQPPEGFSCDWFQAVCRQNRDEIYGRGFTDALQKTNSHGNKDCWLAADPSADPAIPPTDFATYGIDR